MSDPVKSCHMPCGCYVQSKAIVYCPYHASVGKALALLDNMRKYFLDMPGGGGEESPYVKRIDQIIPRG